MSYGANFGVLWRRVASYVARVLAAARPADLPIEQPAEFELIVNAKSAQALGLAIPPSVLAQATEVVQ